jgi:hypothetical protein
MTELGVYILGATALAILAAAGIVSVTGGNGVLLCAVVASGAAYVSQFGAASAVVDPSTKVWPAIAFTAMGISFLAWAYGVWLLF